MSARLASLRFSPRAGTAGWTTAPLSFGRILTLVLGPNGTGKTPILKGLVYALGHPVELPPRVKESCESVTVTLTDGENTLEIDRTIGDGFLCRVLGSDGSRDSFAEEKSFSGWLIERLGIPARPLADKGTGVVPPYMSVLMPMFWIDQDLGWRNLYSPLSTHNFVKDQHEEVARWLLSVPAKHRAIDKGAFAKAKERHESIQERVAIKRSTLTALRRELGPHATPGGREKLMQERDALLADLRTRSSVLEVLAQSHSALDEHLGEATRHRDAAKFALSAAERRLAELRRLGQELKAEVDILQTNEVAADAFRTLCGSENCQFFRRPEESYGRRLLYLKDQLKDFQSSFSTLEQDVERVRAELSEKEAHVQGVLQEKKHSIAQTGAGQIVPIIDTITRQLSEVNLRIEQLDRIAKEQEQLEALIDRALRAEEDVGELRPTGGGRSDQTRLADVRVELGRSMAEWLKTLRTQNLPTAISFDENLRLHIGNERFSETSSYSGSTRTRIVLAYHAAMVETSKKLNGCHPGFLVLDAPKQHELHAQDLGAFVTRFREISAAHSVPTQLVIGATEQDFVEESLADAIWKPAFKVDGGARFFGPPGVAGTPSA